MKIWQRIGVGFFAVIIVSAINFIVVLNQNHKRHALDALVNQATQKQMTLKQVITDHIRWKLNVLVSILNESPPKVQTDPTKCRLGRFMAKLKTKDPEEQRLFERLKPFHDQLHRGAQKMQAIFKPGAQVDDVFEAMSEIYNDEINGPSKKVFEILEQLQKIYDQKVDKAKEQQKKAEALALTSMIVLNCLILATAILFGLWVSRSVTKPVLILKDALKHVAQGDFTREIKLSGKDEIADISQAINSMLQSLRPTIKKISNGAQALKEESSMIEEYSQNAVSAGKTAEERAEYMLEESEKIVKSVLEEGQSINEISKAIQEISENSTKANEITHMAVEKAQVAGETIDRLGKVSQDVQGIIKLIGDIAEQTNLLALNATIEAARAGEAGKGFAVVANEVKELARQTADSTEEITNKIRAIQTESQAATNITREITEVVGEMNDLIGAIAAAVEEQTAVITDIASKVDEQNQGAQNLVEQAKEAANAANGAVDAAKNNLANIQKLAQIALEFQEDVRVFRV